MASLDPVSVIVFPGGFNWAIWIAQDRGYFAASGIEVALTPTPNSVFQLTGLIEGRFDIAHTAIDNVVAYMEGQGEAEVSVAPDLTAFMGGDNGFLALVTQPEIKSYADLRGKTLSVDAMTTGYAFVLFDLLKRNGLMPGDYAVERAGGVMERWQALQQKKHAGTMLVTPFDIMARVAGLNVLDRAIEVYGHYQGVVGAARRQWTKSNSGKLESYVRGYVAALAYLYDAANKTECVAILQKHLPNMPAAVADQCYTTMVAPGGFSPTAELDVAGVRKVLDLRSEYGRPQKQLTDPLRYYDPTYYRAARH